MTVRLDAAIDNACRAGDRRPGITVRTRAAIGRMVELEAGRVILWWPVGFGAGIAAYFSLEREPDWRLAIAIAALTLCLTSWARHRNEAAFAFGLAALAVTSGFASACLRSEWVSAPVVTERIGPVTIEGTVIDISARGANRVAVRLAPAHIERLDRAALPARVRVTMSAQSQNGVEAGERVRLRAVLMPPPGPVAPGAFDFARDAWFDRLGGVGFAVSGAERIGHLDGGTLLLFANAIERFRTRIALRIRGTIPGDEGAIAAALLTGKRGAISDNTLARLRDSGLAHLLAISGLHMALVCGTVFGTASLLLSLVPWLALRITTAKWAAAAALVAGLGYFLLAGGSVSTERAFIMVAISFAAIMLDRPAITMRNVAVAATITLALRPESLNEAGFQMSFGAVIALVAFYDSVRCWRMTDEGADRAPRGPAATVALAIMGVAATTMVATLATGPIAAHHFNRVAVYGLAANLLAVPLAGIVVMPLGLIALGAMTIGVEAIPLKLMAGAIGYIVTVADEVVSWEGAVRLVPAASNISLALFATGGLWLCLWQRRWRLFGLAPVALGFAFAAATPAPDLFVAREAENVALRAPDGRLSVARMRAATYSIEQWLRRDGDKRTPGAASPGIFICDFAACAARAENGREVVYVLRRDAFAEECFRADILISAIPVTRRCAATTVIDLTDIRRRGPYAAYFEPDGSVKLVDSDSVRGKRPWAQNGG